MQVLRNWYWPLALLGLTLLSCKNRLENSSSSQKVETDKVYKGLKVKLLSKSGETFENAQYLPLPLNHGVAISDLKDTLDLLILGLPIQEPYVHVLPLAYFETHEDQIMRKFVLAYPEDEKYRCIEIDSYNTFMRQNYPIKNIIDTWFANYKGLAKTRVTNWKDNFFAEELLIQGKFLKN